MANILLTLTEKQQQELKYRCVNFWYEINYSTWDKI